MATPVSVITATPYQLRLLFFDANGAATTVTHANLITAMIGHPGPLKTYLENLASAAPAVCTWGARVNGSNFSATSPLRDPRLKITVTPLTDDSGSTPTGASIDCYNSGAQTASSNYMELVGCSENGSSTPSACRLRCIVQIDFVHSSQR